MEKNEPQYEDFLNEVSLPYREFVEQINSFMLENNYKMKLTNAKSGYVVSYTHAKTKRVALNFVFRKAGLFIRIYGDNINKYIDSMPAFPDSMIKAIEKASACKRLLNPLDCNSRCPMGYDFTINGSRYIKCRYGSFMFLIDDENMQILKSFIENEVKERASA